LEQEVLYCSNASLLLGRFDHFLVRLWEWVVGHWFTWRGSLFLAEWLLLENSDRRPREAVVSRFCFDLFTGVGVFTLTLWRSLII